MQLYRVTQGWHLIYMGADGTPTYGISVSSLDAKKDKEQGRRAEWEINDYTFKKDPGLVKEWLGLTQEEYDHYLQELVKIENIEDRKYGRSGFEYSDEEIKVILTNTNRIIT